MRILLILLLILPSSTMAADSIGRLFTTPAERASLDAQRQLRKVQELDATTKEEEVVATPVVPRDLSVQGYVKRSDGKKGTVWVNQAPVQEDTTTTDLEVGKLKDDSNQVQLKLPTTGKKIKLKAGQVYSPDTDSVSDVNEHTNLQQKDDAVDEGTIGTNINAPAPSHSRVNSSNESR